MSIRVLLQGFLIIGSCSFWNSKALALYCDTLSPTKNSVHVCDCPFDPKNNPDKKIDKEEEALRTANTQACISYPIGASIKNPNILLPAGILNSEDSWGDLQLDIETLNAEKLGTLDPEKLTKLLFHLGQKRVEVQYYDHNSHFNKHKLEINAAAAVGLMIAIKKQSQMLSTLLAIAPDQMLPLLDGKLSVLSDFHFVAEAIVKMTNRINSDNLTQIAQATSHLVARYMSFWSTSKPKLLTPMLARLVIKMANIINEDSPNFNVRQRGVLLGALLSGSLQFASEIKSKDERRIWIVNTASNITWAATSLLGIIPIAGNVISAVQGIVSITVVVAAAVYSKKGPRDASPSVKEIEGGVELKLLDAIPPDDDSKRLDVLTLLSWMRAVIHVNKFAD